MENKTSDSNDFSKMIISLASPKSIIKRSYGEVLRSETINYRTYKAERNGLFCERIFGPIKDWECYCGKYKRRRYDGIICDRCGVEVTERSVRRKRFGHIKLVIPVAHTWFFKNIPSKMSNLLEISYTELNNVIYYTKYIVIQAGEAAKLGIHKLDVLTDKQYNDILEKINSVYNSKRDDKDPDKFIAKIGAEALETLLKEIDIDKELERTKERLAHETSQNSNLTNKLEILTDFKNANTRIQNRPEWMIINVLPVIPPDLRPTVVVNGGKFVVADLNDLYRKVIIRNNRLKSLLNINAPEIIVRNEKRLLQGAVDALLDNSHGIEYTDNRVLKSLTDIIKGKKGRFRQNLLGKRVDYSGRSVIAVDPELKLYECGIPKLMAIELFKPFIIRHLLERGIASTIKIAQNILNNPTNDVYDILENIFKCHPVLLNRAPTLHKNSFQAFKPKLTNGKVLRIPPLICAGFNADFDGDQMGIHIPLSEKAKAEAYLLMLTAHNLLSSANGAPNMMPNKDIILGLFYLTKQISNKDPRQLKGVGKIFSSPDEVLLAIDNKKLDIHANIKIRLSKDKIAKPEIIETTAGRVIFNSYLPVGMEFVNEELTIPVIKKIVTEVCNKYSNPIIVKFLDDIKDIGFQYCFISGISCPLTSMIIPSDKTSIVDKAKDDVQKIYNYQSMGLITPKERYNKVIDVWTKVSVDITKSLMKAIEEDEYGFNPIYMMLKSGARCSTNQLKQLCGIKGLMIKSQGTEVIETPVISSFKEGLEVLDYFISSHGGRKGLIDTSLKTSDAGYLTRRLVDAVQDCIITSEDCGTKYGVTVTCENENDIQNSLLGYVSLETLRDKISGKIIINKGEIFTKKICDFINKTDIRVFKVRSILTCRQTNGICAKCYGYNLATNSLVQEGEAVGVIAAQSIGEPGTQLTLDTFHVGGVAGGVNVQSTFKTDFMGKVQFVDLKYIDIDDKNDAAQSNKKIVVGNIGIININHKKTGITLSQINVPYGAILYVNNDDNVNKDDILFTIDPYNASIISTIDGTIEYSSIVENANLKIIYNTFTDTYNRIIIHDSKNKHNNPILNVVGTKDNRLSFNLPLRTRLLVKNKDKVKAGDVIALIPRNLVISEDIIGGLPRIVELLEARHSTNASILSELDGVVSLGNVIQGKRELFINSKSKDIEPVKYLIPETTDLLVQNGDYVKIGTPLTRGDKSLEQILNISGIYKTCQYLTKELIKTYSAQNIEVNKKHIEIIVKKMINSVKILDIGDTNFIVTQTVTRECFFNENRKLLHKQVIINPGGSNVYEQGQIVSNFECYKENERLKSENSPIMETRPTRKAKAKNIIFGITQVSLNTKSFISAASFQETVKVLSDAAISGSVDDLVGLKENVIIGRLIPCGTGYHKFRKLKIQ